MRSAEFLDRMHLAVLEESPLHEVVHGSVDLGPTGAVRHGPWSARECAAVLRIWHAVGWLALYFPVLPATWVVTPADWESRLGPERYLHRADAEALLGRPESWRPDRADGHVCLCVSDTGSGLDVSQWIASAEQDASRPNPD